MTTKSELKDKDFQRTIRTGNREMFISLSQKFLKENNMKPGDVIDLRTLKKVVRDEL